MTELGKSMDKPPQIEPWRIKPEDDIGPPADGFPPHIRPGEYDAICHKVEFGRSWGNERRIFLRFRIQGGEFDGTDLFMACNCNLRGKMTYRYKYYQQWMLAKGGKPTERQRLSPRVFLDRMYRVRVRDTNRCDEGKNRFPDFVQYSVVDTIIEPLTGGGERV